MFQTFPPKSAEANIADVAAIADALISLVVGDIATYSVLSALVGYEIQSRRHILDRARRDVEREHGHVLTIVNNVGVMREAVEMVPVIAKRASDKIGRAARRTIKRLQVLRTDTMPPKLRREINARLAQMGAIALASREKSYKKIEEQTGSTGPMLPAQKALDVI